MKIITNRPTSNGIRQRVRISSEYYSQKPIKNQIFTKKRISGRNNQGKITVYYRGGATHRRRIRILDKEHKIAEYNYFNLLGIHYDPNRSAGIAFCRSKAGKNFYILANHELPNILYGRNSVHTKDSLLVPGSTLPLNKIPVGTTVYNLAVNKNSEFVLAAGTSAEILKVDTNCVLRLPSSKIITIPADKLATIGRVNNSLHSNIVLGKAGANRWKGRKPIVSAVAKNAVDHPHGGKTKVSGGLGGAHKTRWGKLAKWVRKCTKISK